ncbi:hypothetical protein M406DRAFT_326039 [Cryphonectria parasitica EP155]|uniref:Uncharacterized protein n=1 Tax=Cryphonectria parasitica (strain ATCC 38755 / EP155) TaxID=660469 RepID=A0A9P4YC28_CRYP1|nr:uncharacterized protein M406DRAFT_326039 [Cryphonectria parasitica EP155]KAF3770593.1 hypothetical protein M406DRAFT_326039 [Cryphonectria parasitica EP155]
MVTLRWIVGVAAAASAASASVFDFIMPSGVLERNDLTLLKRENLSVGSPLYNCHDNCGMAIEEIQNCGSICNDTTFITDYNNCLQCSGSDNEDIWQWYGPELNTSAAACGFSVTPLNGTQDSVGTAITASNTTAACTAAQEASSSASATSSSTSASSTSSSLMEPLLL